MVSGPAWAIWLAGCLLLYALFGDYCCDVARDPWNLLRGLIVLGWAFAPWWLTSLLERMRR